MPTFTQILDDTFARADTTPAPGRNSTAGVGNGWIDLQGSTYCLNAAAGGLMRQRPGPKSPTGVDCPLYQGATAALVSGRVRLYRSSPATASRGAVFRASDKAEHVNGYFLGFNTQDNSVQIVKSLDGFQTVLLDERLRNVMVPAAMVIVATCWQQEPGRTLLSVGLYDPANMAAPFTERRVLDEEKLLQGAAGIMGVSSGGTAFDAARVQLYTAA